MASRHHTFSVLFVEDNNWLIAQVVNDLRIKHSDWLIVCVDGVNEAWTELCNTDFDLLVFDVMLQNPGNLPPLAEGVILANWLRKSPEQRYEGKPHGEPARANTSAPILFYTHKGKKEVNDDIKEYIGLERNDITVLGRLGTGPTLQSAIERLARKRGSRDRKA